MEFYAVAGSESAGLLAAILGVVTGMILCQGSPPNDASFSNR